MKIKQKSPEQLQSQAAAYARVQIGNRVDAFDAVPSIPERKDTTTVLPEALFLDYVDFLRRQSVGEHDYNQQVACLLANYDLYANTAQEIIKNAPSNPRASDRFIGEGQSSVVYKMSLDGQDYALRVPKGRYLVSKTNIVDHHLYAGVIGKKFPALEHVVAGSYSDGIVVSEFIPGQALNKLSGEEAARITQEQMDQLATTMFEAGSAGIEFDAVPENVIYNPHNGFRIIDYLYDPNEEQNTDPLHIAIQLLRFCNLTGLGGDRSIESSDFHPDICRVTLTLLRRARQSISGQRLNQEDKEILLEIFDGCIEGNQTWLDTYASSRYLRFWINPTNSG